MEISALNSQPSVYKKALLEHFNERRQKIEMLVLHSMAHGAEEGIARLDELQLSAHYVIDFDGRIFQCVDEKYRAWHAGVSSWRGRDDLNSRSIGIEVCHKTLGQSAFKKEQIKSLIGLCRDIVLRHNILPQMIVGHSDIAPSRKPDPGRAFPWEILATNGLGLWYGDIKSFPDDICDMLKEIGYDTSDKSAAVCAFCRRFLPQKIPALGVRYLLSHPVIKNAEKLLQDSEVVRAVHNIRDQYQKMF